MTENQENPRWWVVYVEHWGLTLIPGTRRVVVDAVCANPEFTDQGEIVIRAIRDVADTEVAIATDEFGDLVNGYQMSLDGTCTYPDDVHDAVDKMHLVASITGATGRQALRMVFAEHETGYVAREATQST